MWFIDTRAQNVRGYLGFVLIPIKGSATELAVVYQILNSPTFDNTAKSAGLKLNTVILVSLGKPEMTMN